MFSISRRLTISLLVLLSFLLLQTVVYLYSETRLQSDIDKTISSNTQLESQLSSAAVLAQQIRRHEKEYFIYVLDIEKRAAFAAEWLDCIGRMERLLAQLQQNKSKGLTSAEVENISTWRNALSFYKKEMQTILAYVDQQNSKENLAAYDSALRNPKSVGGITALAGTIVMATAADTRISSGKDRLNSVLITGITVLSATKIKETLSLAQVVNTGLNRHTFIFIGIVLAGALLVTALLITLPRAISKPLQELSEAVDNMSRGNVREPAPQTNVKEFMGLTAALDRLRSSQAILLSRLGNR